MAGTFCESMQASGHAWRDINNNKKQFVQEERPQMEKATAIAVSQCWQSIRTNVGDEISNDKHLQERNDGADGKEMREGIATAKPGRFGE